MSTSTESGQAPPEGGADDGELLEMLGRMGEELAFNQHLGVRIRELAPGRCVTEMPASPQLENHIGTAHAIAQLAPAELAGATAAASRLPDLVGDGWVPVLAGLDVRYHAPAEGDLLVATAEVTGEQAEEARADAGDDRLSLPVHVTVACDGAHVVTIEQYVVFLAPEA